MRAAALIPRLPFSEAGTKAGLFAFPGLCSKVAATKRFVGLSLTSKSVTLNLRAVNFGHRLCPEPRLHLQPLGLATTSSATMPQEAGNTRIGHYPEARF